MTITITKIDGTILNFENVEAVEETETYLVFSYHKEKESILHVTKLDEITEYKVK